ncbi:MAG: small multi-drug export protein [Treponema sp.]|jgi:uncharacterized membrane protein|nr:small multi-drug export protein [Treponema sp.]
MADNPGLATYLWTAFFSLLPVSELRGGIPFAMVSGVKWYFAWPFAAAVNSLAAPLCWVFLSTIHRLLYGKISAQANGEPPRGEAPVTARPLNAGEESGRKNAAFGAAEYTGGFRWYRSLFDRFVENARAKLRNGTEKWGALGIALFVAIPLPMTGAWTGTIGAWVLGLPKRKTLPAVILGVIAAGALVTAAMFFGIGALRIFVKAV